MEEAIRFANIYIPGVAMLLTVGWIVYKLSKTKAGRDFIAYLGNESQKGLNQRICEHEVRLNKIDGRLAKGDEKFKELSRDIKDVNENTQQKLEIINDNVKLLLEHSLKNGNGKEE